MTPAKHTRQLFAAGLLLLSLALTMPTMPIRRAETQETSETADVIVQDFAFQPQNLTVTKGDTISWTNTDQVVYTLWFVHEENASTYLLSAPITPGAAWSHVFSHSAVLTYHCFERLWIAGHLRIVKILGDTDWDGDVDYDDFIVLAGGYGSSSGQPAYRSDADFDWDNDIDYDDFIILAGNYGKTDP